jgi:hypothetical protein
VQEFELNFIWEAGGDSVYIVLTSVAPFRLEEKLMRNLVREFDDLVLNGGAISRTYALDAPGIQG